MQQALGYILVVDDTATNLGVLMIGLTKYGYKVKLAANGQEAINIATEPEIPDLILLDILLPDIDGYETCRRLKADPRLHDVPIIFVSALDRTTDKVLGFQ